MRIHGKVLTYHILPNLLSDPRKLKEGRRKEIKEKGK
jgi:hypothetical protein